MHPIKKFRPIPSGKIGAKAAWTFAVILSLIAFGIAFYLGINFLLAAGLYYVIMVLYSYLLKHIVILDIMVIAGGFVIRAIAGAFAVDVVISSWLLVCATLLALFLVLSKRRHEVILLGEDAEHHRKILKEYGAKFLDQMISVVTAATLMSYILYTMDAVTVEKFGTSKLILTTPFVLYGIFRYLYLVYQKNMGGRPEEVLLNDLPIIGAVVLYVVTAVIIIY
ncbi:MAG: UbiA family prenyltransferase [FCB group bacterium]|nr:UbiA family prenyltransferase [FCB group bacterium]